MLFTYSTGPFLLPASTVTSLGFASNSNILTIIYSRMTILALIIYKFVVDYSIHFKLSPLIHGKCIRKFFFLRHGEL